MIKAVIFDFDNTLMDFMKMKRAAVESAAEAMIDAGLTFPKAELVEKIYKVYWNEGIEDQNIGTKCQNETGTDGGPFDASDHRYRALRRRDQSSGGIAQICRGISWGNRCVTSILTGTKTSVIRTK